MITAGIDCGAKNTKTVIMQDGKIIGKGMVLTGFDQAKAVEDSLDLALQHAGITRKDIQRIFGTGSGKDAIKAAEDTVNDIKAMAKGAHYFFPNARNVADVGAEEGRAAKLDEQGNAVDFADKGVRPGKREEDLAPCKAACPAHIDVPGYVRMIARGRRDEAYAIIREKVPLPGVLGRVCIHPCEEACRRGQVNQPVAICALKRYAADGARGCWKQAGRRAPDTGKNVAVVGAGPAGLTVAFYLRKKGHGVTVFEAQSHAGGMMRFGIPAYRLPRSVLDDELQSIWDTGVEFKPNQTLGQDFTLESLRQNGCDAVFFGVGAQLSRRIVLEGCNLPDVLWGVDFLRQVARREKVRLKDNVVVIGGGNVAVDAALTALRCGAREVSIGDELDDLF